MALWAPTALASYVFQEAEGLSREAKLLWATRGGHAILCTSHLNQGRKRETGPSLAHYDTCRTAQKGSKILLRRYW